MMHRSPSQHGLSLAELLAALALAGVIAGTSLAGYSRMLSQWRLNAAARQVVMDLKAARVRAIMENVSQRVHFVTPGTHYQRQREDESRRYADDWPPTALPAGIQTVACTASGANITFQPRGHASTFGTISLRNAEGMQRRVVVDIAARLRVE